MVLDERILASGPSPQCQPCSIFFTPTTAGLVAMERGYLYGRWHCVVVTNSITQHTALLAMCPRTLCISGMPAKKRGGHCCAGIVWPSQVHHQQVDILHACMHVRSEKAEFCSRARRKNRGCVPLGVRLTHLPPAAFIQRGRWCTWSWCAVSIVWWGGGV